jgi:drug/metabolite transporter (DMT)-like permease
MKDESSATILTTPVLPTDSAGHAGPWWGLAGITAFSFTVPFTRVAVSGLSPLFIGSGRAVIAAILATTALYLTRQHRPNSRQWARLAIVAGGVVLGFPLLTAFALTTAPASHGAVVIGLLPAATAVMAVWRSKEYPARSFWVYALLGAVAAVTFASLGNGGIGELHWSDALLFGAVLAAAIGYAEGGLLARELGAWQTISWALVLASPAMVTLTTVAVINEPPTASPHQWLAFSYLAVVSMYLGFFAWYRGLAIGPIAQVSQAQLAQPVMSIIWAAALLHEQLSWPTVLGGLAVIASVGLAVRARLNPAQQTEQP